MGKTDHLRFTIYDLRFVNLARRRRGDAERVRSGILKAMRGRGYKAAGAAGGAYVRWTTYDVLFINNVRIAQIFSDH